MRFPDQSKKQDNRLCFNSNKKKKISYHMSWAPPSSLLFTTYKIGLTHHKQKKNKSALAFSNLSLFSSKQEISKVFLLMRCHLAARIYLFCVLGYGWLDLEIKTLNPNPASVFNPALLPSSISNEINHFAWERIFDTFLISALLSILMKTELIPISKKHMGESSVNYV